MFKNPSRRNAYLPFFRLYFLELIIFLGFCLVSMVGIFYYFKHNPLTLSDSGKKMSTANKAHDSSEIDQDQEPEFEFYSLLAQGNGALPAHLASHKC